MSEVDAVLRVYGRAASPKAYEIRDYLSRSVVPFEWIELTDDHDCNRELGFPSIADVRLPVVRLRDGMVLFAPTLRELAEKLGWISQPQLKEYDLSIYGAGPAGLSAAVYAASEGIKTVLVERAVVGGQAGTSSLIENYLGYPDGVSGAELAERARRQAMKFGVDLLLMREGVKARFDNNRIHVNMADGTQMVARANICATGVEYARLGLADEERFMGKGLFYGAGAGEAQRCEGEDVFVVGGGNSAGQAAVHFSKYASKVTILVRGNGPAASMSKYLREKLSGMTNVEMVVDTAVQGLSGGESLEGLTLVNRLDGSEREVATHRLFVCIGGNPNTEWAKDTAILRDPQGYLLAGPDLLTDGRPPECWPLRRLPYFLETSVPGSFAAGDVRHGSTKRLASAVGEGAMCVTFVHRYLRETADAS
ncbi:MAG TPA: FAD-dependent oxidoreductase [Tepidisphaeraceae bacterium]|jgi:thioredoxin reductase (NADPH)